MGIKSTPLEKGFRSGSLVVIKPDHTEEYTNPKGYTRIKQYYLCQCDCGNKSAVEKNALKRGVIKSCGCARVRKQTKRICKDCGGEFFATSKKKIRCDECNESRIKERGRNYYRDSVKGKFKNSSKYRIKEIVKEKEHVEENYSDYDIHKLIKKSSENELFNIADNCRCVPYSHLYRVKKIRGEELTKKQLTEIRIFLKKRSNNE